MSKVKKPRIIVYHCKSCATGIHKMKITEKENGGVSMELSNCDECGNTVPVVFASRELKKLEQ